MIWARADSQRDGGGACGWDARPQCRFLAFARPLPGFPPREPQSHAPQVHLSYEALAINLV